jgi:hypothetical protein
MEESGKQKTAFATHRGLFQFKVIPFGLSNSPATFERLMEAILSGLYWERCLVYLDDINIWRNLGKSNLNLWHTKILNQRNLFYSRSKCPSLDTLYLTMTCNVIPRKLPLWPTSTYEIRSFIGIASYYRCFIEYFHSKKVLLTIFKIRYWINKNS